MSKHDDPSRTTLARLKKLDSCAISDALDRLRLGGVVSGLALLSGNSRIAGQVITVKLGAGEPPPGPPRHLCSRAIDLASADNVIIIEQRTGIEAGCWGGLLTLGAKVKGIAGVVADGLIRDVDEARACHFPIFARGATARTARGRIVEQATNVAVTIGHIEVNPGDFVIADRSAVAFIAARRVNEVLDAAESIAAREAVLAQALLAGKPVGEVMTDNYEHMLKTSNDR